MDFKLNNQDVIPVQTFNSVFHKNMALRYYSHFFSNSEYLDNWLTNNLEHGVVFFLLYFKTNEADLIWDVELAFVSYSTGATNMK